MTDDHYLQLTNLFNERFAAAQREIENLRADQGAAHVESREDHREVKASIGLVDAKVDRLAQDVKALQIAEGQTLGVVKFGRFMIATAIAVAGVLAATHSI